MNNTLRSILPVLLILTMIVTAASAGAAAVRNIGHQSKQTGAAKPTKPPAPAKHIADDLYAELVSLNAELWHLPNGPTVYSSEFPKYFDKTAVTWLTKLGAESIRRSGSHIVLSKPDFTPNIYIQENQASVFIDREISGDLDEDPNQISLYAIGESQINEYYSGLEENFGTHVKHIAVSKLANGQLQIKYGDDPDGFSYGYQAYDIDASGQIRTEHSP